MTPYHVYELALSLDANADNGVFWKEWEDFHDNSLRRVEAVAFGLETGWFAYRISEQVRKEIINLPAAVQ